MTLAEAKKVAEIVGEADGGCRSCVGGLAGSLAKAFPDFNWKLAGEDTYWDDDAKRIEVTEK
jgi:hypothetical protein